MGKVHLEGHRALTSSPRPPPRRIRRCRVTGGAGVGQEGDGSVSVVQNGRRRENFEFSLGYYYLCPLISGWWGRGRSRQSREIGHVEIYDFSAGPVPGPRLQKEATPE